MSGNLESAVPCFRSELRIKYFWYFIGIITTIKKVYLFHEDESRNMTFAMYKDKESNLAFQIQWWAYQDNQNKFLIHITCLFKVNNTWCGYFYNYYTWLENAVYTILVVICYIYKGLFRISRKGGGWSFSGKVPVKNAYPPPSESP